MALSRKYVSETNSGASNLDGSPQAKKCKNISVELMLDIIKWPSNNSLWPVIRDLALEVYLKSQSSINDYAPTIKRFFPYLSLVVCGLNWE